MGEGRRCVDEADHMRNIIFCSHLSGQAGSKAVREPGGAKILGFIHVPCSSSCRPVYQLSNMGTHHPVVPSPPHSSMQDSLATYGVLAVAGVADGPGAGGPVLEEADEVVAGVRVAVLAGDERLVVGGLAGLAPDGRIARILEATSILVPTLPCSVSPSLGVSGSTPSRTHSIAWLGWLELQLQQVSAPHAAITAKGKERTVG